MSIDPRFTYKGACERALANARRFGGPYYVRPVVGSKDEYCVTDVKVAEFTVRAERSLHDPEKFELRNMENWPEPIPA